MVEVEVAVAVAVDVDVTVEVTFRALVTNLVPVWVTTDVT